MNSPDGWPELDVAHRCNHSRTYHEIFLLCSQRGVGGPLVISRSRRRRSNRSSHHWCSEALVQFPFTFENPYSGRKVVPYAIGGTERNHQCSIRLEVNPPERGTQ